MIITGVILTVIVYKMDYFENIINMVMNKKDSISGYERGTATAYSWQVFLQTMGIGVGLGGLQGGSFLLSMLASLGIVGTTLFGRIYYYLLNYSEDQSKWLSSFAIVLLIAQTISIPGFSFPSMWMYFFIATVLLPLK
jgi:hypothetical protein